MHQQYELTEQEKYDKISLESKLKRKLLEIHKKSLELASSCVRRLHCTQGTVATKDWEEYYEKEINDKFSSLKYLMNGICGLGHLIVGEKNEKKEISW